MVAPSKTWVAIFVLFSIQLGTLSAHAGQYTIDGFTLGDRVSSSGSTYRSYTCKPSDDFAEASRCERTRETRANRVSSVSSDTLIHAQDGTVLYVMSNIAPLSLTRRAVESEIDALAQNMNERPAKVMWFPEDQGPPTSVIAIWGQVKLQELGYDPLSMLEEGKSPHLGVLVDTLGDLQRSAKQNLPVYRITGGPGFVYAASFGGNNQGHRHILAVDGTQLAKRKFRLSLEGILHRDESLANDDYSLWPQVALTTRQLALDTSAQAATAELDKVFAEFPSKKLYSHVWAVLPGGPISHLSDSEYWPVDIYQTKTEHPNIRRELQMVVSRWPADPFIEFAYYTIGDFDTAVKINPKSIIGDAVHYARAHAVVESILKDAVAIVKSKKDNKDDYTPDGVGDMLSYLGEKAGVNDAKLLGSLVPHFAERAAMAKTDFEIVMLDKKAHHADDAAYFLGWLNFQQGKLKEALPYLSQAITIGNGDYQVAAVRLAARIQMSYPAAEQFKIVSSDPVFARQPLLWYVAARSAFREFDYKTVIKEVEQAFITMNIPLDRLPATTDPKRLDAAIERINPDLNSDPNFVELPYILQASKEFLDYRSYLDAAASEHPDVLAMRARAIIVKYSLLVDPPEQPAHPPPLAHKDLRQALHLIDLTLAKVPQGADFAALREWLYYRKVRIAALFAPESVPGVIALMKREFPNSKLLDDVLAEQLFGQGVVMHDVPAAEITFRTLLQKYPNGNAVDNAFSWMAILYRCTGRTQDALALNREILQRFPMTRHAKYARERMANPGTENCSLPGFASNS
jgi:tetratricopeptide (TPR) repeat protein